MKVFEIEFEENNLLLHLSKYYLVMTIILSLREDSRKKQFIQLPDLIDIRKQDVTLLNSDDLLLQHFALEI